MRNLKIISSLFVVSQLLVFFSCANDEPIHSDDGLIEGKEPEQYGIPFNKIPETRDINMYEVNPRVFSKTGDFEGITQRLDSIKSLGINVVWLMPIYPTGNIKSVGSPYAIKKYDAVNSAYGNLDDLRALVEKAHELEMAVILDWVANHTSWDNEWLSNKDWYTQTSNGKIIHPAGTNWQDVADLNFKNHEMRAEMIKMMKYWVLAANIDGFRCDYAHGVPEDFWQQAIDTLRNIPEREIIMFAETEDKELLNVGFDLIFGWKYYTATKDVFEGEPAKGLFFDHRNEYGGIENGKHVVRWTSNHDESAWNTTPQNAFGNQNAALAAFVVTATMGGVPLVYNGQEVGVDDQIPFFEGTNYSINWNQNPEIKQRYKQLLNFRLRNNVIRKKALTDFSNDDVIGFYKFDEDEHIIILANTRNKQSSIEIPESLLDKTYSNALNAKPISFQSSIELKAYQYLIIKTE